jgi:hypothetical protein
MAEIEHPMTRRYDFVLIDLYSQRRAVNRFIANWSKTEILTWICRFGLVTLQGNSGLDIYVFNPTCCYWLYTTFWFKEDVDDLDLSLKEDGRLYMMVNIRRINDGKI